MDSLTSITTDPAATSAGPTGQLVASVAPVEAGSWERIVADFQDASYDQTHAYAAHLWGESRLSHLVLRRDGAVVAAAQVILLRPPLVGRGLAYVKCGPLWRRKDEPADPHVFTAILEALKAEYAVRRGMLVTVLPPADPAEYDRRRTCLEAAGFVQRRRMTDPNRYLVDLSIDRHTRLPSLHKKWRYNLTKSQTHDLTIRRVDREIGFEAFGALYQRMLARKGFDDQSRFGALPALLSTLPPAMLPRVYLGEHAGRPVVGAVIGLLGDKAYYLFGATDDRALALNAGYALHWSIVGELEGCARWYDLGGDAEEGGLRHFKKGLVGKTGVVLPMLGEFDFWTSRLAQLSGDAIFAARSARYAARRLVRRYRSVRPAPDAAPATHAE